MATAAELCEKVFESAEQMKSHVKDGAVAEEEVDRVSADGAVFEAGSEVVVAIIILTNSTSKNP